jgi:hypothetical protein
VHGGAPSSVGDAGERERSDEGDDDERPDHYATSST